MKTLKWFGFFTLLLASASFISCEKVIDVDLNSEDPKVVIEGTFTAGETTHNVVITRTMNFDEAAPYPTVDNAVVSVTDNLGNAQVLTFVGNGTYQATAYPVIEGRTYTLTVVADGKTYTAQSTAPSLVPIDEITVLSFQFGADTINALTPLRLDPAGIKNFYQFNLFNNGERLDGIYLQDDAFVDGIQVQQPIFDNEGSYESGDTAFVEMFMIDEPVYNYFFALLQNQTATPANPTSNFTGGCLGYFSARSKDTASVIIP
jgi:hypothetical protein